MFIMDKKDIKKINKIKEDQIFGHNKLSSHSNVYQKFIDLEFEAFKEGQLKKYQKELIALGISIVINCESCMEWHVREALKAGASEKQIIETIEVAIEMGGGPATVFSRFALKALEYYVNKK